MKRELLSSVKAVGEMFEKVLPNEVVSKSQWVFVLPVYLKSLHFSSYLKS